MGVASNTHRHFSLVNLPRPPPPPGADADGWGQALRWQQWKGIRANRGTMLLYDLQTDIGETTDVAER